MPNQRHPDRKLLGLWVSKELKERVEALSKKSGINQSDLGQMALILGLDAHELEGKPLPKLKDNNEN